MSSVIENKVGGYFGLNMTPSRTEFIIGASVFSPGEAIPVTINSDNSKCINSVKSFKLKVWRKITYRLDGQLIETGEYLTGVKIQGCKPKELVTREYCIPLPMNESDGKS